MAITNYYDLGVVAQYHNQPPFETPASRFQDARSVTAETTVAELIEWADKHGIAHLESLTITVRFNPEKGHE